MHPALGAVSMGLSPRTWKFIGIGVAILAFCWGVWAVVDGMTDRAYADGRSDEKSVWEEAERKLQKKVIAAKNDADRNAAVREHKHAEAVSEEREKIDEAVSKGRSPFDVMFPSSVR